MLELDISPEMSILGKCCAVCGPVGGLITDGDDVRNIGFEKTRKEGIWMRNMFSILSIVIPEILYSHTVACAAFAAGPLALYRHPSRNVFG